MQEKEDSELKEDLKQRPKNKIKTALKLFVFSLYISAAAFGGGFVSLSLIKQTYNEKLKWISDDEFMDFSALSQASPGSISANLLMLIGYKVAGVLGAAAAILGSLIPPFAVITALYYFYDYIKDYEIFTFAMRGMQAGVSAVILSLVIDLWKKTLDKPQAFTVIMLVLTFLISTLSLFLFGFSTVIYLVILSMISGVGYSYLSYFHKNKKGDK